MATDQNTELRIGLAQLHLLVGVDTKTMEQNVSVLRDAYRKAKESNCDVVIAPELSITGYSPEDLLLRLDSQSSFTKACDDFVEELFEGGPGPVFIFGAPRMVARNVDGSFPQGLKTMSTLDLGEFALANSAMIVDPNSKTVREVYKSHLPNWGVFDEARWFASASRVGDVFEIAGIKCGAVVCRDIWKEQSVKDLASAGAKVIFVPNASPYANSRAGERTLALEHHAKAYGVAIVYVNMIEGCDEVVFDGGSFVLNSKGEVLAETKRFKEEFLVVDLLIDTQPAAGLNLAAVAGEGVDLSGSIGHDIFDPEESYKAIVLGTREFLNSINEESKVCIGISGGIDSALVATVAVDALGPERVHGVLLPSKHTSDRSNEDALSLAKNLGITCETISIEKLHDVASNEFALDSLPGIVSENIQSRLRGLALMMVSNSKHYLVLATSNKSESAVGYCTLYGDTVGAYAPIKDVYKTQVYEICDWRNSSNEFSVSSPIPDSIITREPTAELRPDQTDETSLYPYEILDGILELLIDHDFSAEAIVGCDFDSEAVERVIGLVKTSEFKRKQTPLGPRLTRKNFGKGRRFPISAHW